MQRSSSAFSLHSSSLSSSSFVLRSIVLPYLSAASTLTTSSARPAAAHSSRAIRTQTSRCTHSRSHAGGRPCASGVRVNIAADRLTRNRPVSSFQQVRGHDPPTASSSRRPSSNESSAQIRTREYLGLRNVIGAGAANSSISKGEQSNPTRFTPASHHAETSAMALQRILQAYTGRSYIDVDTKSETPKRKGKDKAIMEEEGASRATANPVERFSPTTLSSDPSLSGFEHGADVLQSITTLNAVQASAPSATYLDPSDLPPVISRLLKARLFRLSVFHLLSTPQYATNGALLLSVANLLEEKGAGKLARRLRRGWQMHQEKMRESADLGAMEVAQLQREVEDTVGRSMESSVSENAEDTGGKRPKDDRKLRLWSDPDPKGTKTRLPVDQWNILPTPPSFSSTPNSSSSMSETPFNQKKSLTTHYNAHLQYLLTRPYLPSSSAVPVSSDLISMSKINDFPSPAPNLQQLRRLLLTIRNLEKRGFVPDRQTANIVLKCWLRCSAPAAKHRPKSAQQAQEEEEDLDALMGMGGRVDMRSYRMHKNDIDGTDKVVRKVASEKGLRPRELRKLFEVLSGIIASSYPFKSDLDVLSHRSILASKPDSSSSPSSASATNLEDGGIDPAILRGSRELGLDANMLQGVLDVLEKQEKEQQREYDTVVKPFARMMIRSMRAMGDAKGVERVVGWLQAQKKLLVSDEWADSGQKEG